MTPTHEAAMRQALEALELINHLDANINFLNTNAQEETVDAAIEALREALAQQGEQPHPACKADVLVNSGALRLALNSLRRGTPSQKEIADELEKTAAPAQEEQDRATRIGTYILETAKTLGWKDDGEGAYEYIQRLSYAQGVEDAKAAPAAQSDKSALWPRWAEQIEADVARPSMAASLLRKSTE